MNDKRWFRSTGLFLLAVLFILPIAFPLYWALALALQESDINFATVPRLIPDPPSLHNFGAALNAIGGNIVTSMVIAVGVVTMSLLIAVPAAYGLSRYKVGLIGDLLMLSLLVAQMIPGISLTLAFYNLYNKVGLLNTEIGLVLADSTIAVPFAILITTAYMRSIPDELFDAASTDGCGPWRAFRSIGVPLAIPGIITAALFCFLFAWGDFVFAFTLTSGAKAQPLTLGIFKFVGTYYQDWGPIMATVVLAAIPSGLALTFAQRWVVSGLRAGALKG